MTDSQRILDSIRRLVRLLRLADRAAQNELGLSGAQLFVLQELGKTPSLSLNELAERTRTDQSSVSVVERDRALVGARALGQLVERQRRGFSELLKDEELGSGKPELVLRGT